MTSRHLVDQELLPFLDAQPPLQWNAETLAMLRTIDVPPPPIAAETLDATTFAHRTIGPVGDGGPLDVVIAKSKTPNSAGDAILHVHGGGYILGKAAQLEFMLRPWAQELECTIVSVDYRLAPETRFPGAVEDCYAALAWMCREAEALSIDRGRIGVKGESAGGGLAAALALLVRDRCEYTLAFQHLTYPMLDDRSSSLPDPHPYAGEFLWTRQANAFGWSSLLGAEPGGADVSPYAAAARAMSLAGLPPSYLATGALDLFVEENISYATRLLRDGVPTELHIYPGAYHGFDLTEAAVSKRSKVDALDALKRWMGRGSA